MVKKLFDVQREALKASHGKPGFAFFMEMGLGKTLTALAEFFDLVETGQATRMVVFCPNSFKGGWAAEIRKQGLPFSYHIYESGSRAARAFVDKLHEKPPVLIVNYEAVRGSNCQELIVDFCRDYNVYGVFDESIQISTHDSNQTKACILMAREFKYRRILSGKPMKQGPHDYWSQMRAIGQLDGVNYYAFRSRFCTMGGFKGKQVVGMKNADVLADIMAPVVFQASKEEWTDLPPKLFTTRDYVMSKQQQDQYDSMFEDFVLSFQNVDTDEESMVAVEAAITKYIKLAQIQAGFVIDEIGKEHPLVTDEANPRLRTLLDILENVKGKVAIPYHHKYSGRMLQRALSHLYPAVIQGGMDPDAIENEKATFNTDSRCRVILLQTRASKYGHTLVGGKGIDHCSTMVFYENTYSLDDRSQIEDRIHRHGQEGDNCLYVDLAGSDLDRDMTHALQEKESLYQVIRRAVADAAARLKRKP